MAEQPPAPARPPAKQGRDTPTHCWAGVSCPLSLAHGNVGSPARWSLWPRLSAPAVYWRGVLKWEPGGRSPVSAQPLTGSGKFAFSLRASVSSSVKWGNKNIQPRELLCESVRKYNMWCLSHVRHSVSENYKEGRQKSLKGWQRRK